MRIVRRANPTLTFALCASLVLHALLLSSFLYWYAHRPPVVTHVAIAPDNSRAAIIVNLPPPAPPEPKKKPPDPKTPPPQEKQQFAHTPPPPLRDDSGETNGIGTANRSTPGAEPMQSAQGLEQAKLSRNSKPMPDDSASALDTPPAALQQVAVTNAESPAAVGVPSLDESATPSIPDRPKMIAVADPTQAAAQPPKVKVPSKQTTVAPAVKRSAAQPGRSSDTDSTPFAKANSVTFKDGKMLGRQGRRVRTTHIGFGLSAESDAMSLADPRVVLGVTVDASGNVQNVIVLRSSGSDNIDLPAQNALYNWWFEPLKNPAGQALPDVWVVTIE